VGALQPIAPIWEPQRNVYRDALTGRFVSKENAIPWLRFSGGALRDVRGHFVPWSHYGGDIANTFPTGKGTMSGIVRDLGSQGPDFTPRERDMLVGVVEYTVFGEPREAITVALPKGEAYDPDEFEDRLSRRITGAEREGITWEQAPAGVEITGISWQVTSWYEPGEFAGSEYSFWGKW